MVVIVVVTEFNCRRLSTLNTLRHNGQTLVVVSSCAPDYLLSSGSGVRIPDGSPQKRTSSGCPYLWTPRAAGPLRPPVIKMLGGNEFRLRQDFCLRQKCLYGAHAPPRSAGPRPVPATFLSEQGTTENLAAAMVMPFFFTPQQFLSFLLPQKTTKICDIRSLQRIKNHTQLQTKLQMKSASISGGGFLSFRSLHLDAAVGASRRPEGGFSSLSTLHSSLFSHSVKLSPGRRTLASYPSARQDAAKAAGSWAMAGKVS